MCRQESLLHSFLIKHKKKSFLYIEKDEEDRKAHYCFDDYLAIVANDKEYCV